MRTSARACLLLAILFAVGLPVDLDAQSSRPLRLGFERRDNGTPTTISLTVQPSIETSHWKTGLLVGAALGALVGNLLLEPGSSGGKRLGVTLAAATPTGAIGAFIGGLFPKRPSAAEGSRAETFGQSQFAEGAASMSYMRRPDR